MIADILIITAVVLVIFIVVVALRSPDFRVARSASIAAPPAAVFPHVNDLRKWQMWSPWAKMDPNCKINYDGPEAGTGASYTWAGNKKVGEGRLTVMESCPGVLVRLKLEFMKPFQATNSAEFTFKPDGGKTVVTWAITGRKNFMFKAFSLFKDCDKMIGADFEKGLASLKALVEGEAGR